MSKIKFAVSEKPVAAAFIAAAVWAAVLNVCFLLCQYVISSMGLYMVSFGFLYPAVTIVINFKYGKTFGIRWYLYLLQIAVIGAEFIFVNDFKEISPNPMVVDIICFIFAGGIGSCFADEEKIKAQKQAAARKRHREDVEYVGILEQKEDKKSKSKEVKK